MHRTVAGVAIAVLALGMASCGGGSKTLTKADFAKQVNAVCGETQKQMNAALNSRQRAGLIAKLPQLAAYESAQAKKLEAIASPPELKDQYARFKASVVARHERLVQYAAIFRARRSTTALEARAKRESEAARRVARQLGLRSCPSF